MGQPFNSLDHLVGAFADRGYGIFRSRRADHSALILAARTTVPHFSISNEICLPNSSGVLPTILYPRAAIRSIISGHLNGLTMQESNDFLRGSSRDKHTKPVF